MEQAQINAFDAIRGTTGTHYQLAKQVESLGLAVQADTDNNERSIVKLAGVWAPDGSDIEIGEILGDSEAKIV